MSTFKIIDPLGMIVTAVIPALVRLKQEDDEFEASLDYIVSLRSARVA
jgi:hypothetical protein